MKNLFSHLIPTIKKIQTEKNGILELTSYFGNKKLNSQNANYSYGSLQRILNFALVKINLSQVEHILLLGLGGGCVIHSLRKKFHYQTNITAIEFDNTLIEIALNEFQLASDKNLKVNYCDASDYISNSKEVFGLIIIDLFIDDCVPDFCFTNQFWMEISNRTLEKGIVIFNAEVSGKNYNKLTPMVDSLKNKFSLKIFDLVEGVNTVLIAEKL